jgi:hypothetical protein
MIRLWQFIARIGRSLRSETAVALYKGASVAAILLAVLFGLLVVVQGIPEWQVRRASVRSAVVNPEAKTTPADVAALQNEMRKTFIQVVGGAFALYLTYRRVKVAEQGHITDRYTKAIEQLGALTAAGKPNVEVRLGAIYALERIARDSARDHWAIIEVLTAYVRQNAHMAWQAPTEEENRAPIAKGPATEIQAILTVLGRRRRGCGREREGQTLDLRSSDLRSAVFDGAHIDGVDFRFAHLDSASFNGARVGGASFDSAYAKRAKFYEAHLEGTSFELTHLEGADFYGADFSGADESPRRSAAITTLESSISPIGIQAVRDGC